MSEPTSADDAAAARQLDRVNAFSDGVFAIAITLLVLGIEVPSADETLSDALRDLDSNLRAYFIGFALIGGFWFGHSALFSNLRRASTKLVLINLLLLSMIALMPFTTSVLGSFDEPLASAIFAVNVGLAATFDSALDRAAVHDDLYIAGTHIDSEVLRVEGVIRPVIFLLSIPLAWVSVEAAQLSWFLLFFTSPMARRIARRDARP